MHMYMYICIYMYISTYPLILDPFGSFLHFFGGIHSLEALGTARRTRSWTFGASAPPLVSHETWERLEICGVKGWLRCVNSSGKRWQTMVNKW